MRPAFKIFLFLSRTHKLIMKSGKETSNWFVNFEPKGRHRFLDLVYSFFKKGCLAKVLKRTRKPKGIMG